MAKEGNQKEQIPLELNSELVRRINKYIVRTKPKFRSRTHFFEMIVTEYMKAHPIEIKEFHDEIGGE